MQQHLEHDVSRPLKRTPKIFSSANLSKLDRRAVAESSHPVEGWQPWGRGRVGEDNQGRFPARTILCLSIFPIALVYDVVLRHPLVFIFTFTGSPRLSNQIKSHLPPASFAIEPQDSTLLSNQAVL
jgi:hypothetical protein